MENGLSDLTDQHKRQVTKLRVSLTDRCNLRCSYCMPVDSTFMEESELLTPLDYHSIIGDLVDLGLKEVRLTGGEPMMRKQFAEIVRQIAKLPLNKISITTNAIFLNRHLETLLENGVESINVSLDSLDEEKFRRITHGGNLEKVLKNIDLAIKSGMQVKLNVVAMNGVNIDELDRFVDFSAEKNIEVRFLELMRIGFACNRQKDRFISADEIMSVLKSKHQLKSLPRAKSSTSFNFSMQNGANIGFIASESRPFCGACNRWRLSADGKIFACLLKNQGISVKNLSRIERANVFRDLLPMKPKMRPKEVTTMMNSIGG